MCESALKYRLESVAVRQHYSVSLSIFKFSYVSVIRSTNIQLGIPKHIKLYYLYLTAPNMYYIRRSTEMYLNIPQHTNPCMYILRH